MQRSASSSIACLLAGSGSGAAWLIKRATRFRHSSGVRSISILIKPAPGRPVPVRPHGVLE